MTVMDELLQQFEAPVTGRDGRTFTASLYGRSRPGDTWQGWIVFEERSDGSRYSTGVETTQSDAAAILYWANGLTEAYFEGALERALAGPPEAAAVREDPPPLIDGDADLRAERRSVLENAILTLFARAGKGRMLVQTIFDALPNAHADIVRAIEDLEKNRRLAVRKTEEGNDWLMLTADGARTAGLTSELAEMEAARPHPPPSIP